MILTEEAAAIQGLKSGKAAGKDKTRPEMLKALNGGVLWLTSVCQVAWKLGKTRKDWQRGVIILICKIGNRKECKLRIIEEYHFLAFQERCMPSALKENGKQNSGIKVEDGQCGVRPGRSSTDQIFTLEANFREILGVCKGCLRMSC